METTRPHQEQWLKVAGLIFVIISLALRFIPHYTGIADELANSRTEFSSVFIIIAMLTILYVFLYIANGFNKKGFKFWQYGNKSFIFAIILLSIGSFSLNDGINVFSPATPWLAWVLGLSYGALTCYAFFDKWPRWLGMVLFFFMGLGTLVTLFYTLLLAPALPIALIGIIFFGLGFYLMAPLFSLIVFIRAIALPENRQYWKPFAAGAVLPLAAVIFILVNWKSVDNDIRQLISENKSELPNWLYVDMHLEESWITEYYLLKDVQYTTEGMFQGVGNLNGSINRYFDPLVIMTELFAPQRDLYYEDRIKILEARYDFRHIKQRRLWSGNDLMTTAVETDIQVWPEYRMAYVEQEFVIHHEADGWGTNTQEAIYTFYLPDGAVASSLSLWINGKEEFSRLTTKSKADSAYTTIVGVEQRDPALLHWQEGNTLVVTVFPCTPTEDRRFSIGVTVPMKLENEELSLPFIAFKGPYLNATSETTTIRHGNGGKLDVLDVPMRFSAKGDSLVYDGPYKGAWDVKLPAVPLATQGFSFDGHSYSLKPYEQTFKPFKPTHIALDLNGQWEPEEISTLANLFKDVPVFVPVRGNLVYLSSVKNDKHFEQQMNRRYSLFPFDKIKQPEEWLIITKTTNPGILPGLLNNTGPGIAIKNYFADSVARFNMLDIGDETSLYLNTFRQFGVVNYHRAEVADVEQWYAKGSFPAYNDNPAVVELEASQMQIVEDTITKLGTNTPDHLLRVFAYNKVLHQIGGKYFKKEYVEEEHIALAKLAHVVTPVSSMVVLETVKDYERFGIDENTNSLKNAGMKAAGAVPEPHEWALIVLSLVLMGWLYIRRRKQTVTA